MKLIGFNGDIKIKVHLLTIFAILGLALTFTCCSDDCEIPNPVPEPDVYPFLKVENQNTDRRTIIAVNLVVYEFKSLSIPI